MSRYRILVIGSDESINSPRATELIQLCASKGNEAACIANAKDYQHADYDLVFFLSLDPVASAMDEWVSKIKAGEINGRFLVLYNEEISTQWRDVLDPEIEIGADHALAESIDYLFEEEDSLNLQPNSNVGNPMSFDLEDSGATGLDIAPPKETVVADELLMVDSAEEELEFSIEGSSSVDSEINLSAAESEFSGDSVGTELFNEAVVETAQDQGDSVDLGDLGFDSGSPASGSFVSDNCIADDGDFADALDLDEVSLDSGDASLDEAEVSLGMEEPVVVDNPIDHPDSDISKPLAGRETFNADISLGNDLSPAEDVLFDASMDDVSPQEKIASMIDPEFAKQIKSEDIATVQKYAAIKERESREKEATIQVLKGQMGKLEAKLSSHTAERRRLSIENDDFKNQVSTLEEELSQKQFHIQKLEGTHQEEVRAISLRLDNAIFQANKAQNKLEDFRDRVRGDFVKIRAQERELSNKLELQKRDAEALLASKDEQLLNQRREVDRMHYELEGLRERMIEETEKAEDRSARMKRATQSLKLANDLLSGLTEEVLPTASEKDIAVTSFDKEDEVA